MNKVTYLDHFGHDLMVVNAARVSFNKVSTWDYEYEDGNEVGKHLKEKDVKLINYLAKHEHESPFTFPELLVHVEAPIFVARQLVKHKVGFCWNEMSRRYVDEDPTFFFPNTLRGKPVDKKQGSTRRINSEDQPFFISEIENISEDTKKTYNFLLDCGICPEQARMILPQNTMTQWYWKGSLLGFIRMCKLRCKEDAQEETREVAKQVKSLLYAYFPVSTKAWLGENPHGTIKNNLNESTKENE